MATMLPSIPDFDTPESEKLVFETLQTKLPDSIIAIHGKRFSIPGGHRPKEGEIDFLILHPERGYLALEVKGGQEIRRDADGWKSVRTDDGRSVPIKDPGAQSQDAVHTIGRYMANHKKYGAELGGVTYGWGVCFPGFSVHSELDPSLPRRLIVDATDLPVLGTALERVFDAAGVKGPPLTKTQREAFLACLNPHFNLVASLGDRIRSERPILHRLTDEQIRAFELLDSKPRATISGPAGCGKTMIAMEKARRLAEQGLRVQFLCFNRPLADHLGPIAEGFTVSTFHSFARRLIKSAGLPYENAKAQVEEAQFWNTKVPELLLEALEAYPDARWDALIVDEAQDFREDWWIPLSEMLVSNDKGQLFVFFDPNQDLYCGQPSKILQTDTFSLKYNCRNTKAIASHSSSHIDLVPQVHPSSPEGVPVRITDCAGEREMLDSVRRSVHRLVAEEGIAPDRIVIMSPASTQRSSVWRTKRLGNFSLIEHGTRPNANEIRFTSLQKFKGLEADVLILCEVKRDDDTCSPNHLYVGTSRARHVLEIHRYV